MNALRRILLIMMSLALVAFGLFLPDLVLGVKDYSIIDENEFNETDRISLGIASSYDISEVIEILSGDYTTVEVSSGMKMGKEEPELVARELLAFFEDYKLPMPLPENMVLESQQTFIAISDSGTIAPIVWELVMRDTTSDESMLTILIDDESGKVVSFYSSMLVDRVNLDAIGPNGEIIYLWAQIWVQYYESDSVSFSEDSGLSNSSYSTETDDGASVDKNYVYNYIRANFDDLGFALWLSWDATENYAYENSGTSSNEALGYSSGETDGQIHVSFSMSPLSKAF